MAVTPPTHANALVDEVFDPFGPLDLEVIHPVWTTTPAELARIGKVSYDRTVDTLHILRPHDYRGGVVVQVGDERFVITEFDSHVVAGIQIEAVLTRVVHDVPALFDEIERAELRDITLEQIQEQRRRVMDGRRDPGLALAEFYAPDSWSEPLVDDEAS